MELWLQLIFAEHKLSFCVLYNSHYLINAEQMSNNMIRTVQLPGYCKQVPKCFLQLALQTAFDILADSSPPVIQHL